MPIRTVIWTFLLFGCIPLVGCRAPVRPREVLSSSPDKDVIVYLVELEEPLSPREYLEFADYDLSRLGHDPVHPDYAEPIYEVFYSFHQNEDLLATVHYRRAQEDSRDPGTLEHLRTRVYPPSGHSE